MAQNSTLELSRQLQQLLSSNSTDDLHRDVKRQACDLAHKIWLELEEPGDLIDRLVFQPEEDAILRVALDLGIHEYLMERDTAVASNDVAKHCKTDSTLMTRILRNLASYGHIDEVDVGTFKANKFSKAFTTPKATSMAKFSWEFAAPSWRAIPAYLKSVQYKNPTNPLDTPMQQYFKSDKHFFELLVETNMLGAFQTAMSFYRGGRPEFLDLFPAEERLTGGYDYSQGKEGVLLVDVGGGQGHEVQKFIERLPNTEGRLVLQDQAEVIDQVPKTDAMEVMVHDFFTPQPVQGARAYYFRMIFHDWPDEQCLIILKHTAAAMKPGYSRLLINDIVLPDTGASRFATTSDMNMLAHLAAMERSEAQWRELLELAGLRIIKIWQGNPESVIEAEVAN